MGVSRYAFSRRKDGWVAPSKASYIINTAIRTEKIAYNLVTVEAGQRLDQIAGHYYGDGTLWWIIAAASGIGWGLQVPPGVVLKVPLQPGDVLSLLM